MHMLCLKEEFEIDGFQRKMLKSWQKATQRQTQSSFLPIVYAVLISLTVFVLCVATQAGGKRKDLFFLSFAALHCKLAFTKMTSLTVSIRT